MTSLFSGKSEDKSNQIEALSSPIIRKELSIEEEKTRNGVLQYYANEAHKEILNPDTIIAAQKILKNLASEHDR